MGASRACLPRLPNQGMTNIFRKRLAFPAQNIYLYRPNNSINHTTMMKQTLLPACAALLLLAGSAQAQSVTIEGIEYTVDMYVKTAVVTNAEQNIKTANVLATVDMDGTVYPVTAIDEDAFNWCQSLQSITLPEGVQTIGDDAFAYCPLRSITSLAATPPAIENSTFDYDTYATATLTVPEGAEDAYRAAEGWKLFYTSMAIDGIAYTIDTEVGTATVTNYRGSKRDVAVPATVKYEGADYPVTVIGDFAFSYCSALQSITLPEGVQSIGDNAFQSCTALQSVTLPESLENIAYGAFLHCSALQSITLPERLQTIGNYAFWNFPLEAITCLATTPPAIEKNTFIAATYTDAALTVPEGTEAAYRAAEGWKLFFYSTKTNGIIYTVDTETQTAAVTGADSGITAATIPATVNINGMDYPVTAIGDGAFSGCSALQSVTLPEGLQNIGERAFSYCDALQSVAIPERVVNIGDWAFSSCTALQSVTLPERLQNIGEKAFHECPLEDITCHAVAPPAISEDVFEYIVYATANLNVAIEAENAYRATEGWELFYSSMAIDGIAYTIDTETGTAYVSGAIPDITTANIPAKIEYEGTNHPVTAIGYEAFQNCTALQSVTIPEGVTTLCDYAFSECESLQSVALPQGLVTIGGYVFRTCISLKDVILPEGLTSIGKYSFIQCRSLESIHLPSTLQSVGHDAFRICPLKDIICQGTTPASLDYHVFDKDTYVSATLHVPSGAEAAYYAAKGWRYFAPKAEVNGIVYALNPYNHDAAVFTGPQYAASVTIPSTISYEGSTYTVDDIGIEAFSYRNALQSVSLPEGLQNIGERAFSYCDALQSITLPEELQTIGESAFTNCTALQSVTLPEGLQSIEDYAFYWCKSLQNIILPSTLQSIGTQGFAYCPLTDVHAYATRPPVIDESTFSENAYATATLHVPSDVTSDYQAAEYWKEFLLIVGDLPSTAISSVATDASLATYAGGILTTESPAAITVYAQNGAQALHTSAATSLSLAGLPGGIYIICIDMEGQRQVMKVAR